MSGGDVVVVGAGSAGLVAARTLARAGCRVTVLEGRTRTGGRVWTASRTGRAPVELGAEFVHGEPAELFALAREAGLHLDPADADHLRKGPDGFGSGDEVWQEIGPVLGRIHRMRGDRSVADVIADAKLSTNAARTFAMFVEGFHGGTLDRISAKSVAEQTADEPQFRVREGYGAFVAWLERDAVAHGARIFFGATVRRVSWRPGHVVLEGQGVDVRADAVVLAVPLPILQSEDGIAIDPPIARVTAGLAGVEMGAALRVPLLLREDLRPQGVSPGTYLHAPDLEIPTFWLGEGRDPRITAWCGGPRAARLAAVGPAAMRAAAIQSVAALFDRSVAEIEALVEDAPTHPFPTDPFTRGAYPFLRVGANLAGAFDPEAATLFFAGDYLDPAELGTVGAAVRSGELAARALIAPRG